MKRFYFPLLLMAAAAVAACQNKAAVEEPAQGSYVFTLKASAPDAETKTDYSSTGKFSWSEGDAISVLFHNEAGDNKFFTLTATTINGANADFSGTIDEGYVIGNSLNDIKWALYPAGAHEFDASSSKYIKFNIPSTMDLSSSYSSNAPMYAKGDGNVFAFKFLDATYKFTFTGIPNTVSKVKFVVENQYGTDISGSIPLSGLSGDPYFSPSSHGASDPRAARTFIGNVTNGVSDAFYVPVRRAQAWFTPKITLYDASNDDQIFTKTAANPGTIASNHIQPITVSVSGAVVVPWEFTSAYGIHWNDENISASGDAGEGYDGIKCMKATSDATNLYLYLEVKQNALYDNAEYGHSNYCHIYFGNGTGESTHWAWETSPYINSMSGWMKYHNAPRFIHYDGITYSQTTEEHLDLYCYELSIARADISALQGSSATVSIEIDKEYTDSDGHWQGSYSQIGFVPARWNAALSVPLYVAP